MIAKGNGCVVSRLWTAVASAALLCAAGAAMAATPGWTGTAWTSPITPAADNILSPAYMESPSANDAALCDHVYDLNVTFGGSACSKIWNLPKSATVSAINIYGGWKDTGRADIYVTSVAVKYSVDGEWEVLANSGTNYYCSALGKQIKARYAMSDGSTLASGIVALKISFPYQQNGGVGIYEIELSGAFDEPLDPDTYPYAYDFGNYDPSSWTASENNMMGLCTSMLKNNTSDITTSSAYMIDGAVASANSYPIAPGSLITWNFSKPFTLDAFKVFSRWGDNGRDAIVIYQLDTKDENDVWTTIIDMAHPVILGTKSSADQFTASGGTKGGTGHLRFALTRSDGEPIATDVTAIRVRAGYGQGDGSAAKWNEACWIEVEAIGSVGSGEAIFDASSPTFANDCWEAVWSAKLSSLGASDSVTLNLWTSLDNETFTLADSRTVTEINTAYWFTNVFDSVNSTIWYKFETVNTDGVTEWRTTNEVASVVNYDNATYWWRSDVVSGAWESGGSWSNSYNDARLSYPDGRYTTADFSLADTSRPVAVSLSAAHTVKLIWPQSAATVTFSGSSPVAITNASASTSVRGTNIFAGVSLWLPASTFLADARLRFSNGAKAVLTSTSTSTQYVFLTGNRCGIELESGAELSFPQGVYVQFCNDAEILLNGGSVVNAGYFTWSGSSSIAGHIVFGPEGGRFISPWTHSFVYSVTTPLELRYEMHGTDWHGYDAAPLALGFVNSDHTFGKNGKVFVNVEKGAGMPSKALDLELITTTHPSSYIVTNGFTFAAFGKSLTAGESSTRGDAFLWTYDHNGSLEPTTPGSRPTGLIFRYAGCPGLSIFLR